MKKIIILLASLAVLGLLGWYTSTLFETKGKSDSELIEFNIEDTSTVDKIIISDAFSNKIELVRESSSSWSDNTGDCVTQANIDFILETFKNIEFKGYVPDNSMEQYTNLMASQSTKVEIYQNGEWVKTWYIGPASQDHYGQVMLLDSEKDGKSGKPVIMKIKNENGIIEPRFFADKRKWACTKIWALTIDQIAKVDLKVYDDPVMSFTVTKKGTDMSVFQQGRKLQNVDTSMIYRYLQRFKKIHYERVNFELNPMQVDSLKKSMPFAKLTVVETNGHSTALKMYRIKGETFQQNEFGEIVNTDMDKFWVQMPNGSIVKCQYFVFNPIIMGHIYFPMDMTNRKSQAVKQ